MQLRTTDDPGGSHTRLLTPKDSEMMLEWHDLNARHAATFLPIIALLILFFIKSAGFKRSVYDLLTMFLKPIIVLPMVGLLANVAFLTIIAVVIGRKFGLWQTLPVVTATVWAITTGVSLFSLLQKLHEDDNAFSSRAVALLGPSSILAAFMGVEVLSFLGELILLIVLTFLVLVVTINRSHSLTTVCSVLLFVYVAGSIIKVMFDWGSPVTMQALKQSILLPTWLAIGTLPYIRLLVVVERVRFSRGAKCKTVRAIDYGSDWPLTVASAKLCCRAQAVWVEVNGRKYGVNGLAEGFLKRCGYACFELNDIWRDNPNGEAMGPKVSIGRLIQEGLALERQC